MAQPPEITQFLDRVSARGDAALQAAAQKLKDAANAAELEAAARAWCDAAIAKPGPVAHAVLDLELFPELTALISDQIVELLRSDPPATGGLRRTLPLGPVELTVEAPPALATVPGAQRQLGFLGANGLEVALNAGFLSGSGSAAHDGDRFLGSLGARLGPVTVSVYVVIGTVDGAPSVLALLGARFTPGIQLGFGFQLSGVGGLVGVNHRSAPEVLRDRLASGQLGDTLFPGDPRGRSTELLRRLADFFPPQRGSFVVGPTVELTWVKVADASLFTADLGVFIELPGPARILVVGSARAQLGPRDTPLLYLRLDILGDLDFQRSLFALDAALVDSHALGVFRVTGSAAVRISWGDRPYAVVTIGGFFPGFKPEPAQLPPLERVGLALESGLGTGVYLRAAGYLAVTSNTLQLGGHLEAGLSAAGLRAGGFIGLDALIQHTPFWFTANFEAGLEVSYHDHTIAGVSAHGTISGPGPVTIQASLEIDILFFSISWDETFHLGSGPGAHDHVVDDVIDRLAGELKGDRLTARNATDPRVVRTAKPDALDGHALLAPVGTLVWRQHRVPLGLPLDRVEGVPLARRSVATVTHDGAALPPTRDWFAPGAYLTPKTTAEAMNQPSFEVMNSGLELSFDETKLDQGTATPHALGVKDEYLPTPPLGVRILLMHPLESVLDAVRGRNGPAAVRDRTPKVTVRDEPWVAHRSDEVPTCETHAHVLARQPDVFALSAHDAPVPVGA